MPTFADEEDKINNMISQDDDDEEEEEEEDDDGEIVMQSANTQTTIQTVAHQPQSTTGNVSQVSQYTHKSFSFHKVSRLKR